MKIERILNNELELLDIVEWGETGGLGRPVEPERKITVGEEFVNWAEQGWNLKNYKKIPNPPRIENPTLEYIPYNFVREAFIEHIDHLIKIRLSGVAKGWTELTIGEEFIIWSEQKWQLKEQYDKPTEEGSESCPYSYVKSIFINKIDSIIKDRL